MISYYELQYSCVHGGREHKSKSGGARTNTHTYRNKCPFLFKFRASKDGQKLQLVDLKDTHNHELSEVLYQHYPRQRKLDQADKKQVHYIYIHLYNI